MSALSKSASISASVPDRVTSPPTTTSPARNRMAPAALSSPYLLKGFGLELSCGQAKHQQPHCVHRELLQVHHFL
jgi:hypothetical protein